MNWNGKRFVPYRDETFWHSEMGEGVYDTRREVRVVFTGDRKLSEAVAKRLNREVPKGDRMPQYILAEKIKAELKEEGGER